MIRIRIRIHIRVRVRVKENERADQSAGSEKIEGVLNLDLLGPVQ